ncbi:MAG: SDR family oxidoreductase [Sandaracinus sp.]|nr:SDR family oxidoreductase [Sandaracinus sp.]MCB9636610.1 SDR family oxidoreductase [Sandaracinus sp.]
MRILVAGATGYLGRFVVAEGVSRGWRVRALVRDARRAAFSSKVELFEGRATETDSLARVAEGVDVVVSSLGITRQTDRVGYAQVDYGGNLALLREAERAGARRFVYVSVLHPEHTRHTDMVREKERFVAELRASSLSCAVVRPTGFFSDMAPIFEMARGGRVWVFGEGDAEINPIHGADLAELCLDVAADERSEVEVGGPETFTQRAIAELAFDVLGKPPKIASLPDWLVGAGLAVTKPLSRRRWNVGAFVSTVCRRRMVGPAFGRRRLRGFFEERAAG